MESSVDGIKIILIFINNNNVKGTLDHLVVESVVVKETTLVVVVCIP